LQTAVLKQFQTLLLLIVVLIRQKKAPAARSGLFVAGFADSRFVVAAPI
jgi:hypothetical protein